MKLLELVLVEADQDVGLSHLNILPTVLDIASVKWVGIKKSWY